MFGQSAAAIRPYDLVDAGSSVRTMDCVEREPTEIVRRLQSVSFPS